jgi:hypothetical protein
LVDYLFLANLLTGLTLIFSSVGPLTMGYSVGIPRIRNLTYLLSSFLIVHGTHHLVWALGYVWLSHDILEPASVIAVIAFGVYLYHTTFPATSSIKSGASIPAAASAALGAIVLPATIGPGITAILLFVAFAIFVLMVAKNPSPKSLHWQFAIFLSIWALSEVIFSFQQFGISIGPNPDLGLWVHFASMVALGIFVNYRFFGIWKSVKKIPVPSNASPSFAG